MLYMYVGWENVTGVGWSATHQSILVYSGTSIDGASLGTSKVSSI